MTALTHSVTEWISIVPHIKFCLSFLFPFLQVQGLRMSIKIKEYLLSFQNCILTSLPYIPRAFGNLNIAD